MSLRASGRHLAQLPALLTVGVSSRCWELYIFSDPGVKWALRGCWTSESRPALSGNLSIALTGAWMKCFSPGMKGHIWGRWDLAGSVYLKYVHSCWWLSNVTGHIFRGSMQLLATYWPIRIRNHPEITLSLKQHCNKQLMHGKRGGTKGVHGAGGMLPVHVGWWSSDPYHQTSIISTHCI